MIFKGFVLKILFVFWVNFESDMW